MTRRSFDISQITINGRIIRRVIVDTHVRKHKDVTDEVILDLIRQLDHTEQVPDDVKGPFEYFSSLLFLGEKPYRLVWLLEDLELYVGVITAYRDERKK